MAHYCGHHIYELQSADAAPLVEPSACVCTKWDNSLCHKEYAWSWAGCLCSVPCRTMSVINRHVEVVLLCQLERWWSYIQELSCYSIGGELMIESVDDSLVSLWILLSKATNSSPLGCSFSSYLSSSELDSHFHGGINCLYVVRRSGESGRYAF